MPRRPRLTLAGVPVHLIQRGHNRDACFFAEEDYALYLDHLAELSAKFGCAVHAYVLMTNHVHLLLTPQEARVGCGEARTASLVRGCATDAVGTASYKLACPCQLFLPHS